MPRISWSAAFVLTVPHLQVKWMFWWKQQFFAYPRIKYDFDYPLNIVFCCRQTFRMPLIGPSSRQPYVQWTVLLCIHCVTVLLCIQGLCVPCPQLTVTARSNAQCSKSQLSTSLFIQLWCKYSEWFYSSPLSCMHSVNNYANLVWSCNLPWKSFTKSLNHKSRTCRVSFQCNAEVNEQEGKAYFLFLVIIWLEILAKDT